MDLPSITPPDVDALRAAVARHAELAVPLGGLGRLAELGCWLAAAQGHCPPHPPGRPRVVVVAADHGIAAAGVSRYPGAVTLAQVEAVRTHTAPVAVLAPVSGASIRVVDVGLDHDSDDPHHVRRGSGRIDTEDALTAEEVERALAAGRAVVDDEVDSGADLLIPASLGVGATTAACTLVSVLTGAEPVAVIGRGSGIDDHGWMRKAAAVRDALRRARPHSRDPMALLAVAGGADIAALAGFLVQAAARRTPVLLDGLVVGAAAMIADELCAGARDWWTVTQRSPEPAMTLVTEHLSLSPLLDLGMRTGDGTGAVAALPLMQMAARVLAETATAQESGILPAGAAAAAVTTHRSAAPEPTGTEPAGPEPADPDRAGPEPVGPDPAAPRPVAAEVAPEPVDPVAAALAERVDADPVPDPPRRP